MFLLIFFAFIAGIVTVLSPCILPVLPIVLSGSATGGKKRPFGIIVGFVISFTFFTLFTSLIVQALHLPSDTLRNIAIVVLILFGISLFIPQMQVWFEHLTSKMGSGSMGKKQRSGFGGGFIIGLTLGLFWTPCVGPILAGVITLAATSSVTLQAFFITLAYSLGTAIPMFFIALGGRALLNKIPWVTKNTGKIQKVFGAIMILLALGLFFNWDRVFQNWVLTTFPQYGSGLTKFEENDSVQRELQKLQGNPSSNLVAGNTDDSKYPAAPNPNFDGATQWINSEPLSLDKLKGKVVLVDFWTYTCINCIRTLPHLTGWYEKYKDQGLVVIGVHTPEFEFEKLENNLRKAMQDYHINYPVVQDNDYKIWTSYSNHYWPAEYFIDKDGQVRKTHFGEGEYETSEQFIQTLLAETGAKPNMTLSDSTNTAPDYPVTPESYLGNARLERFASPERVVNDTDENYSLPENLALNNLAYGGVWKVGAERAMPKRGSVLELNFQAKEVYLVMRSGKKSNQVKVYLDGQTISPENSGEDVQDGMVKVVEDRLYRLVKLAKPEQHTLRLEFPEDGVEVYAFTFG